MPNRFEDNHLCWNKARRSPAFWAGLSELWSHFVGWGAGCPGVSVASVPAWVSWQYLLYSKLSFNSFLAHSDCHNLINHQQRRVWLWLQWSELHPATSPMTRTCHADAPDEWHKCNKIHTGCPPKKDHYLKKDHNPTLSAATDMLMLLLIPSVR